SQFGSSLITANLRPAEFSSPCSRAFPGHWPPATAGQQEFDMPLTKVKTFLDANRVKYVTISHSKAYTAQGIAAIAHISGKELAKSVIVKLDGALAMAVLPASFQVDL